jgi:hypothetical protein
MTGDLQEVRPQQRFTAAEIYGEYPRLGDAAYTVPQYVAVQLIAGIDPAVAVPATEIARIIDGPVYGKRCFDGKTTHNG